MLEPTFRPCDLTWIDNNRPVVGANTVKNRLFTKNRDLGHPNNSTCLSTVWCRWATLECDPEGTAAGLPNHTSPSDHLPIAASFTVLAIAEVPEERKQEIASIAAGVEQTQLEELRQVHETQGEVQRTVEQEEAAAAAPEENVTVDEDDRKKKKSKKGKPSAKMIACIQAKRAIVKAVQEEHRGQRQAAVAGLGDQELDVLEKALGEAYGLGIEGWVEQGSAALKKAAKA
eukprot:TRINITY_DN6340_c0_g1_i1.p1 TRINITY_DN6340_c0_g1~~TRINITY_DN6340_c0_g1_i1.p1  ORF type:complete len:230 (-),score=69.51 TRINITY_DN6340_c0_g1_i1:39-728(-)